MLRARGLVAISVAYSFAVVATVGTGACSSGPGTGGSAGLSNTMRRVELDQAQPPTPSAFGSTPRVAPTPGNACPSDFPVGCGGTCCRASASCVAGACLLPTESECGSGKLLCGKSCCPVGSTCGGPTGDDCVSPPTSDDYAPCGGATPVDCGAWCCATGTTCSALANECSSPPDVASCTAGGSACGSGTCCPSGEICDATQQCDAPGPEKCPFGVWCGAGCCQTGGNLGVGKCFSSEECLASLGSKPTCDVCPGADYCAPAGTDWFDPCSACTAAGCTDPGQPGTPPPGSTVACGGGGCPADATSCATDDANPAGVCCPPGGGPLCGDHCCAAGLVCDGSACACPANSTLCGAECCGAGEDCVNGKCLEACLASTPNACGPVCCGGAAVCAGDHCACPSDHPSQCGEFCCLPGAACVNDGQDCGCPPGEEPCDGANSCCPLPPPPTCSDPETQPTPCPEGPDQCCTAEMVCCHDSANGDAIGCEFAGFCD